VRCLGIDPGALRLGWAVTENDGDDFQLLHSGITTITRAENETYSAYRIALIKYWVRMFPHYVTNYKVNKIVMEQLPAVGSGNFAAATQDQLAKTVATTIQAMCSYLGWEWKEVAATTVKKKLTGNGHATKVKVRDAVIGVFPHLASRKKELTEHADESDAIGISLVGLGYQVGRISATERA
jgi:Holliday junction resolvasome RuvABC endonuclease subunit